MGQPYDSENSVRETPLVLVFGGDPINLRYITRLLSMEGYNVRHTGSAESAVAIVREEKPDIAIVDLSWPGRVCLSQISILKSQPEFRDAPLILLGEQDDENWITSAYLSGATDYIRKPYGKRELLIRIDNQLYLKQKRDVLVEKLVIKDKMLSIIGHDLKNPIYRIQQILDEIRSDDVNEEERDRLYVMIDNATVRASNILNDLLEWARIVTGDRVLNDLVFSAVEEVSKTVNEFNPILSRKELMLEIDIDDEIQLNMDKYCFSMILRNLLENAVKFSKRGGRIRLRLHRSVSQGDDVQLQIKDEGLGIDPVRLQQLFKEEHIQSYPGTENERGSGLGLLLVREFVNRYRGNIDIESKSGQGTSVSVVIPGYSKSRTVEAV